MTPCQPFAVGAGLLTWLLFVRWMKKRRNKHKALDGSGSVWRVHNLLTANELRYEAWLAMSARGLLLTYSIPSISGVLIKTGGFEDDVQRRYADMELLIREFSENAVDGTRGEQPERALTAIKRLNAIHAQYGSLILMRDMQYVLSIFMLTPALWCDTPWGSRKMTTKEKHCVYLHWMTIGRHMNIDLDWRDFDAVVAFKQRYEEQYQRYRPTNEKVAQATISYFVQRFPTETLRRVVEWVATNALAALQAKPADAAALGFPHPPPLLRLSLDLALRVRAFAYAYLIPPCPLAWTDRLTGVNPVSSRGGGCPFHMYAPSRALDFGNTRYGPQMPYYALEQMGPPTVPHGLLVDKPKYQAK
jgi:hypothetical protein